MNDSLTREYLTYVLYNSVPVQYNEFMQLYYSALPVFADERCITAIISCLCSRLWGRCPCDAHRFSRRKYETYYGERYEAERENLRQKEADMDKTIEERATQKSFEQLAGKYRTESDPEDVVAHEAIEVIEPDQFGELDDYETSS